MNNELVKNYIIEFQEREFPRVRSRNIFIPESKKIRTIIGARRVGKTYVLFNKIKELMSKDISKKQILYLNFEHPYLRDILYQDYKKIFEIYWQIYPEIKKLYLFIDEPQVMDNWEAVVRAIHDEYEFPIYITGSSSKILSSEIATSLRGRSIKQTIYPLSFKEFLEFKNSTLDIKKLTTLDKAVLANFLKEYLQYGGYPEVVLEENFSEKLKTLKEYLELIVYKDIIERYNIKNNNLMMRTMTQLIAQATKETSINKIFLDIKSQGLKASKNSIYSYYTILEESLFIHSLKRIDKSIRKEENSKPKTYLNDTGFLTLYNTNDFGKKLENIIFIELKRRMENNPLMKINYYKSIQESTECDFIIREADTITKAIQVCYDLNGDNKDRELKGLVEAMKKFKLKEGLIITFDQEQILKEHNIKVVPVWKWLLEL